MTRDGSRNACWASSNPDAMLGSIDLVLCGRPIRNREHRLPASNMHLIPYKCMAKKRGIIQIPAAAMIVTLSVPCPTPMRSAPSKPRGGLPGIQCAQQRRMTIRRLVVGIFAPRTGCGNPPRSRHVLTRSRQTLHEPSRTFFGQRGTMHDKSFEGSFEIGRPGPTGFRRGGWRYSPHSAPRRRGPIAATTLQKSWPTRSTA